LSHEKVWQDGKQILNRPDKGDSEDKERLTQTHLEQINANMDFRAISKFLETIMYLHLIPQLLRYPEAFSGAGIPGDPFGRSFLERVARTPEPTRKSRLKKIEEALRLAVPQLNELTAVKDTRGVPHLEAVYKHWRAKGAKQREDQFSDGTLRLIGLLWSLLEGESPLLLEEPEISLNAAIVSKIPALIFRMQRQKKRQIFISTHSFDMLSDKGVGGKEVVMLTPGEKGTTVEVAGSIKEVQRLLEGGMSVADAVLPRTAPPNVSQLALFK
jgi:predicted ATPase